MSRAKIPAETPHRLGSSASYSETDLSAEDVAQRALASFKNVVYDWRTWIGDRAEPGRFTSPLTNTALPLVPESGEVAIDESFSAAQDAQTRWARTRIADRGAVLRNFESLMWKYQEQILDVIQWETGKARQHAFDELLDVSVTIGFLVGYGPGLLRTKRIQGAMPLVSRAFVARRPVGVVGIISPWNYPFTLAITDAAAALLAGNPVVLKPASNTPLSAIIVASLLGRANIPSGVFQLVSGPGSKVGPALVENSDFVMFTGSTQTGRIVGKACTERLIGFSAELGGKNPD